MLAIDADGFTFPDFDEGARATTFYTTGTTGDPKAVAFSHRQIVLHDGCAGWVWTAGNGEPASPW